MKNQKQQQKLKPPIKSMVTRVDPTINHKLRVIAAEQNISLGELTKRILTYDANAYMSSTPPPPLPHVAGGTPMVGQIPYVSVVSNGNGVM